MSINYHKNFIKQYKKRIEPNLKLDRKFHKRLDLFIADRTNSLLNDHQLSGDKLEYRSFSITGDLRVEEFGDDILLYDIGTHN